MSRKKTVFSTIILNSVSKERTPLVNTYIS